jgi:hypothetical protein
LYLVDAFFLILLGSFYYCPFMASSPSNTFIGGATLQKELQGFAGLLAYQECFRKVTSTTKALLEKSMGEQYFGNSKDPDSIGLAEQLILGTVCLLDCITKRQQT